jgi:hypothetical protein
MNYVVGISLFLGVCLVLSALYLSLLIAGLRARRAATAVRTLSWLTAALLLFTVLSIAAAASLNAMGPATYMVMWYAVWCSLGGFGISGVLFILLSITALVETVSRRRWGQAAVALTFSMFPSCSPHVPLWSGGAVCRGARRPECETRGGVPPGAAFAAAATRIWRLLLAWRRKARARYSCYGMSRHPRRGHHSLPN